MKKSKLFILIILFIFITGCGYKDIYEENQEALDNLNCSYTSEDYYSYSAYPTSNYTITVTADSKGVYFTHEKLKTNIINNSVKLGSYYLRFSENELKSFLESYKANGCPNQFFAAAKAGDTQYLHVQSTCAAGDGVNTQCFLYKLNDKSESKPQHTISKSPTYNRYIKAIKKQVKYSFSYDFDSKTSFLEVDGVTYEIKDKSLMEPISETTNYWAVYPTDYNDIFKIDKTNKTVDWPELVYVMQKSKDQYQYQVLYFTIDLEEYEVRNDFYDENEARSAIAGNWDPDKLCDDDKCNIDITAFCLNPYVARTLKFLGILIAIVKIIVPAIIIILGFVDLVKIVISGKAEDAKKKATDIFKRIIIGMVIFLIPTILITVYNVAYNIANDKDEVTDGTLNVPENFKNCVGCILDATNDEACIIDTSDGSEPIISTGKDTVENQNYQGAGNTSSETVVTESASINSTFTNYTGKSSEKLSKRETTNIKLDKDMLVLSVTHVNYAKINANVKNLTWKSSNTNVATVNKNGEVRAKEKGSATITATSKEGLEAKVKVEVITRAKYLGNRQWVIEPEDYTKEEKENYINLAEELCHSDYYQQHPDKYTYCPAASLLYYEGSSPYSLTPKHMKKKLGLSATNYLIFVSSAKQTITLMQKNSNGVWKALKKGKVSTGKDNLNNSYRHDYWIGAIYGNGFTLFSPHPINQKNPEGTMHAPEVTGRAIHIGGQLGYPHSGGCIRISEKYYTYLYSYLKGKYGTLVINL